MVKQFLTDRLRLECEEFNSTAVAGTLTFARLSEMLDASCFAFLILTAEDQHSDATRHARENVIHEVGLFQGRLGPERAIVLLEDGCEEFSNIHGLGQLRFPRGRAAAVFEDMRRVLEREGVIDAERRAESIDRRETLSSEARNLLSAAAEGDGTIIRATTIGGTLILAGGTSYGSASDRRATARWIAGLDQLVREDMVRDSAGKGELSDRGYRTADSF